MDMDTRGGGGGGKRKAGLGAPKQKWTLEEENALRAGVEKYGSGKWRAIQKDPKLGLALMLRSNVDLKDKWRNMTASSGGLLLGWKEKDKAGEGGEDKWGEKEKVQRDQGVGVALATTGSDLVGGRERAGKGREGGFGEWESYGDKRVEGMNQKDALPETSKRYKNTIMAAVAALEPSGRPTCGAIEQYLEKNSIDGMTARFGRTLVAHLKELCDEGMLMKTRKEYQLTEHGIKALIQLPGDESSRPGKRGRLSSGGMRVNAEGKGVAKGRSDEEKSSKKKDIPSLDVRQLQMKSVEEATQAALMAVAAAEADAAAAEAASAEAEAAEAYLAQLESAARAARPLKKRNGVVTPLALVKV